jgi:hypothetical protein
MERFERDIALLENLLEGGNSYRKRLQSSPMHLLLSTLESYQSGRNAG